MLTRLIRFSRLLHGRALRAPLQRRYSIVKDQKANAKLVSGEEIARFLHSRQIEFRWRGGSQIAAKTCPLCPKPHKNLSTNFWTLNFKTESGVFMCFRCGSVGSWQNFVRKVQGEPVLASEPNIYAASNACDAPNMENVEQFVHQQSVSQPDAPTLDSLIQSSRQLLEEAQARLLRAVKELKENAPASNAGVTASLQYLLSDSFGRGFNLETLLKFRVGLGEEMFRNELGKLVPVPTVYFPMVGKPNKKKREAFQLFKVKIRGVGKQNKRFQRVFPAGVAQGFFGLDTIKERPRKKAHAKEQPERREQPGGADRAEDERPPAAGEPEEEKFSSIVITEGEYDAMAVWMATGLPVVSLPNGASSLPHPLLQMLEGIDRVYLWMDFDEVGQLNIQSFTEKIGVNRTFIVKELMDEELDDFIAEKRLVVKGSATHVEVDGRRRVRVKDANDALLVSPLLVQEFIRRARSIPQQQILRFKDLRDLVKERLYNPNKFAGVKSVFFPWFNSYLKGFRRGE